MSTSDKKRHPLRKLIFLAVLVGIVVAIKNALEDKGGSYEAPTSPAQVPTPPTPSSAPAAKAEAAVPPVTTAEEIVEQRPVENLDEFADPVVPAEPRRTRKRSSASEALEQTEAADPADRKIDPFGIR